MLDLATATARRCIEALESFTETGLEPVIRAVEIIAHGFTNGHKLMAFGNGGSAADAQHLVGELINRFQLERPPLPALALGTDCASLTAIANDYSYEEIFAKQIKGLGNEGDLALGISTSGRSPNVLAGLSAARERSMVTIGLTGKNGGEMAALCDVVIAAPTDETPRIQEVHALVIHLLCELLDLKLFGRSK